MRKIVSVFVAGLLALGLLGATPHKSAKVVEPHPTLDCPVAEMKDVIAWNKKEGWTFVKMDKRSAGKIADAFDWEDVNAGDVALGKVIFWAAKHKDVPELVVVSEQNGKCFGGAIRLPVDVFVGILSGQDKAD